MGLWFQKARVHNGGREGMPAETGSRETMFYLSRGGGQEVEQGYGLSKTAPHVLPLARQYLLKVP